MGIAVVAGIIAVILLVALLPMKAGDVPPPIIDITDVLDDATIEK